MKVALARGYKTPLCIGRLYIGMGSFILACNRIHLVHHIKQACICLHLMNFAIFLMKGFCLLQLLDRIDETLT